MNLCKPQTTINTLLQSYSIFQLKHKVCWGGHYQLWCYSVCECGIFAVFCSGTVYFTLGVCILCGLVYLYISTWHTSFCSLLYNLPFCLYLQETKWEKQEQQFKIRKQRYVAYHVIRYILNLDSVELYLHTYIIYRNVKIHAMYMCMYVHDSLIGSLISNNLHVLQRALQMVKTAPLN